MYIGFKLKLNKFSLYYIFSIAVYINLVNIKNFKLYQEEFFHFIEKHDILNRSINKRR